MATTFSVAIPCICDSPTAYRAQRLLMPDDAPFSVGKPTAGRRATGLAAFAAFARFQFAFIALTRSDRRKAQPFRADIPAMSVKKT
jgi:hypothetical protein